MMVDLRCPECFTWMQECCSRAELAELDKAQAAWRALLVDAYERSVTESMEALAAASAWRSSSTCSAPTTSRRAAPPSAVAAARGRAGAQAARRTGERAELAGERVRCVGQEGAAGSPARVPARPPVELLRAVHALGRRVLVALAPATRSSDHARDACR